MAKLRMMNKNMLMITPLNHATCKNYYLYKKTKRNYILIIYMDARSPHITEGMLNQLMEKMFAGTIIAEMKAYEIIGTVFLFDTIHQTYMYCSTCDEHQVIDLARSEVIPFTDEGVRRLAEPTTNILIHHKCNFCMGATIDEVFQMLPLLNIKADLPSIFLKHILEEKIQVNGLLIQLNIPLERLAMYEIRSEQEQIETAVNAIVQNIGQYMEDRSALMISLNEMIGNAFDHGNKWDRAKRVRIISEITNHYVHVAVEDEGKGFDWRQAVQKEIQFLGFTERGRGIGLTRMCSESLLYNEKGNKAHLLYLRKMRRE